MRQNIQEADAELWQSQTVYLSNADKGEFVFMTGVDTKYPVKDSYYKNAHFYEKYSPFVLRTQCRNDFGVFNIFCQCSMACCNRRSNGKRWRTAFI